MEQTGARVEQQYASCAWLSNPPAIRSEEHPRISKFPHFPRDRSRYYLRRRAKGNKHAFLTFVSINLFLAFPSLRLHFFHAKYSRLALRCSWCVSVPEVNSKGRYCASACPHCDISVPRVHNATFVVYRHGVFVCGKR